uniref:Uncharacterized protein n=1 Tax=Chelonoidis abingdonii TaxID=106734 RepID=A0A8C0IW27_CHEAB
MAQHSLGSSCSWPALHWPVCNPACRKASAGDNPLFLPPPCQPQKKSSPLQIQGFGSRDQASLQLSALFQNGTGGSSLSRAPPGKLLKRTLHYSYTGDTPISRALSAPAVTLQTTRLTQTGWCGQESLNRSGLLQNLRPMQLYQWERLPWTGWLLFTWGLQCITAEEYTGKDIGLTTCKLTVGEYAATLSKHIRKTRKAASAQCENLSSPVIQELSNMARFYVMHPEHDMKWTLKLNPKARTFDQQLADNKAAFKDL